ncbi:hypothetical protein [Kribbella sp. NPDC000426]|uniref:hypothetical protein n=1 Tax=Kribbella sp. NPDC000426 TaxID=3154255 RepID=UPI0033185912
MSSAIRLLTAAMVTLGLAASPSPDPSGAGDASPRDYQGAWLVVIAVGVVVVIVGAGTYYLQRTRRIDLSQTSEVEHRSPPDRHSNSS